MKLNEDVK